MKANNVKELGGTTFEQLRISELYGRLIFKYCITLFLAPDTGIRFFLQQSSGFRSFKEYFFFKFLQYIYEAALSVSMEPFFLFDDFFFLWAAVPAYTEQKKLVNIHLLGPVFSSYTSDSYIKEKMDIKNMSVKSKTELLSLIDQIPVLPTAFLSHYVCQLYYTLNDALITVNDIKLQ